MMLTRRSWALGVAGCVAGCGFRPLYRTGIGQSAAAGQELAAVDIALLPDRSGQLLRQALQQRFDGAGAALAKRYSLSVSYGIAADAINIQRDSTASRIRETATASWRLNRLDASGTLVTNGTARALDGLNVLDQQYFAADLENDAVRRRLSDAIADQITLQVATYFASRPPA